MMHKDYLRTSCRTARMHTRALVGLVLGLVTVLLVAALAVAPSRAAEPQTPSPEQQKAIFEAAKTMGRQQASKDNDSIGNGKAAQAVSSTVQGYTTNPKEAQSYSKQDGGTAASSVQAQCQADPKLAHCAGIAEATKKRDLSGTSVADPALGARVAIENPQGVLGNIAQTYNACSTGGQLASGQGWSTATCQVQSSWNTQSCVKTLSIQPVERKTCPEGEVIGYASTQKKDWGMLARSYCSLPTGGAPMRFEIEAWGSKMPLCSEPYGVDVNLYAIPNNPMLPMELPGVSVHVADGSCKPLQVWLGAGGCQGDYCSAEVHFTGVVPAYEMIFDCTHMPGTAIGDTIAFDSWAPGVALAKTQCYRSYANKEAAELAIGKDVMGGTGKEKKATTSSYWALVGNTAYSHYKWFEKDHTALGMSFPLPRVYPEVGDVWSPACAALDAMTPGAPPDGVSEKQSPVLPPIADWPGQRCVRVGSKCLDGPSTHVIDGKAVTRACWAYQNTYACTQGVTAQACAPVAAGSGCAAATTSKCLLADAQGNCLQSQLEFTCKTADGSLQPALNCGDSSYCANGSCWQSSDTTSSDNPNYGQTMAQFQARAEASKDIALEPLKVEIFKGRDMRCTKDNFGLDNCCSGNVVSQQCSKTEIELKDLSEAGKCASIGSYCSKKSLFGCQEKTATSCCYNSLLARIVQQQGRAQLSMDWGDAKKPNCAGFTPDELAKLDWAKIDLSEYYAQLQLSPKPIPESTASNNAQSKQPSCYYGEGRC